MCKIPCFHLGEEAAFISIFCNTSRVNPVCFRRRFSQPILDIDFECCRNFSISRDEFLNHQTSGSYEKKSTLGNDQKTSFTNAIECFSPTKNRLLFFLAPNWLLIFLLKEVATAGWDPQLWLVKLSPENRVSVNEHDSCIMIVVVGKEE